MLESIENFRYLWDTLDIFLVALIFYYILRIIEGTRASQILIGLIVLSFLYFVSQRWGLFTLNWLLGHFLGSIILVVVILFQNDIRNALARIGKRPMLFRFSRTEAEESTVDKLVKASTYMSSKKIGAIIAIERANNLNDFVEIGMELDANISTEIIISIFNTQSPLHDGAVILRNNKILSAGSFFPIETDPDIGREMGTRHRAAIGLSSETDAIVIVVSEESGLISIAYQGEITRGLDAASLNKRLTDLLGVKKKTTFKSKKKILKET
ncbi:MAG: diadenylate cyclase CdaA [Thermodesulfobacteriota bacterium]